MEKSVYLLYEADQWLSNNSLVLMGIFSSEENLFSAAEKLARKRGKEHLRYAKENGYSHTTQGECIEDILSELERNGQTLQWETNYYTERVELDKLEEMKYCSE